MAVDIKNLIAAINPDVYCDNTPDDSGKRLSDKVKETVKKEGYLAGAKIAKLRESIYADIYHLMATKGAFSLEGLKAPIEQHKLTYDAYSQSLEPIYFWILDFVNGEWGESEKLIDNFITSVGGGHFAEMQGRATRMQEEGMKILGSANTVIRSIMNIIYDLKEFKMRLKEYDNYHSKDPRVQAAATFALKQIWMDGVDIKRGNSSIKGLAQQFDYVTLIDAFMAAGSLKDLDKLDLNDRVKRILQQRIAEFESWTRESEIELRKRFEIERTYLKSQVSSVQLYARWAKPYLKAARQLEQNAGESANIINAFNTTVFELAIMAKGKYDPKRDVATGELPKFLLSTKLRKYTPICIIEFSFRSIPERFDQKGGYGFRGKVDITFTSFALNDDELKVLREQLAEDDFGDVYNMIEGATDRSLAELRADLDELLGPDALSAQRTEKPKSSSDDTNPFSALFEFTKSEPKKEDKKEGIKKDSDFEKVIRSQAILGARITCRKTYNEFKKSRGMPALPPTVNL